MTFIINPYAFAVSGPFLPSSVAGHAAQYRAKELSLSDMDPVPTWPDTSVNSNDVSQGNGSLRPIYHDNGGDPYVAFTRASAHHLTGGDVLDLGTNSLSVFIVAKRTSADGTFFAKSSGSAEQGRYGLLYSSGNGIYGGVYVDSVNLRFNENASSGSTDSDFVLYELHIDRVGGVLTLNRGGSTEDTTALTPDSGNSVNITNPFNLGIYIVGVLEEPLGAEVKQYDFYVRPTVVSGGDLTALRSYYTTEFSL